MGSPRLEAGTAPQPSVRQAVGQPQVPMLQMLFFSAATAKAFTTVLAGFAFTTVNLPNIIFLPAFVAGFFLVLTMQTPGSVNLPDFFTSAVAIVAMLSRIFAQSDLFSPAPAASFSAKPPLVIAWAAFGAMMVDAAAWEAQGEGPSECNAGEL